MTVIEIGQTVSRRCGRLAVFVLIVMLLPGVSFAQAVAEKSLKYSVSWIGNSFSGKHDWVLQDVAGIFVDSDGTLFTNVFWDEGGGNVQEYKDGKIVAVASHTHGWGYEGGDAVAANSRYLFIAQNVDNEGGALKGDSWPAKGASWAGVSRRLRSDIKRGASFADGRGKEGDVLHGSFLPVTEFIEARNGAIRGLCATETRLFVSSPYDNTIKVFDAATMRKVGSWQVDRPDEMCIDREGYLWILQRPESGGAWKPVTLMADQNGPWKAIRFTADGKPLPQTIEFGAGVIPAALCADNNNRLLVADAGPDQQIKIYDDLDKMPKLSATVGEKGGIFAGPVCGQFGDLRFNKPTGVGTDSKRNIYVASSGSVAGGSTVIECYTPDGKCAWRVTGLTFVDLPAIDPLSDVDLFTKEEHFVLDDTKPPGADWTYRGYTVNPYKYPKDPRLSLSPTNALVRRINGQKFLFVSDMTGEFLHVYRFYPQTDGETAIPCALFGKPRPSAGEFRSPDKGEWLWLDRNGNGLFDDDEYQTSNQKAGGMLTPDNTGSIWNASGQQIRCLPVQGLDTHGIPVWDLGKAKFWPKPPELDDARRLHYCPDSDVMLLGGNKGEDHNQHWKPMGPVLCCYDHWNSGQQKLRWRIVLPYERGAKGHESAEPISFDVAGDYIFVAYTRGLKRDGLRWAFVKIYRLADAAFVGNLTSENDLGETGLLDLVQSVNATKRANGQYVILLEDDEKAKVLMFRWQP